MTIARQETERYRRLSRSATVPRRATFPPSAAAGAKPMPNHSDATRAAHITPGIGQIAAYYLDERSMRADAPWRRSRKNPAVSPAAFALNAEAQVHLSSRPRRSPIREPLASVDAATLPVCCTTPLSSEMVFGRREIPPVS